MKVIVSIGKFLLAIPAGYFGGNIEFGYLFEGSWLPYLMGMFSEAAQNYTLIGLLWLTRAVVFFGCVIAWLVVDRQAAPVKRPQENR